MAMEAQTGDGPSMTSGMPVEEQSGSMGRRIFLGPRGIRPGWRILMFVATGCRWKKRLENDFGREHCLGWGWCLC